MNKFSKFFAFAAASIAFVGCTSDEPAPGPNNENGEAMYLNVAIRDANSRAAEGEFEYGTDNEGKVSSANFYFFDAQGVYVGQATIWDGGTASTTKPDENIEFRGNNVLVLNKLQNGGYPNYMITVLNGATYTDEELTGKSMADFSAFITNWGTNTDGGFQMSTTSYFTGNTTTLNHNDDYYYATKLETGDFYKTATQAMETGKAVNVYVERLAARVEFSNTGVDTDGLYKVTATIAGFENDSVGNAVSGTDVYVRIDSWGLNQTIQDSYLSKQLKGWTTSTTFGDGDSFPTTAWAWNNAANFRSYWGQSTQYGAIDKTTLKVFTPAEMNLTTTGKAYCNENTTTYTDLKLSSGVPNQQKTTNVEIMATVGTKDAEGHFVALDLVEHNGLYFTKDRFLAYAMDAAKTKGYLNYYTKATVDNKDVYTQIDSSYFKLAGDNNQVYIARSEKAFPTLYSYVKNAETGNFEYVEASFATTADQLKGLFGAVKTRAFTGGKMHYTVPVAHLNTPTVGTVNGIKQITAWGEGSYGLVRNHAYKVNVSSVIRLGQGIFDPNQDIVTDEDNHTPEWYLGATINILSWKIVNNNVEL